MVVIPRKLISSEMIRNFTKPTPNHAERIQIGFSNNDPPKLARQVLKTTAMETKASFWIPSQMCSPLAMRTSRSPMR
jgi:hypothetical protein